MNMRIVKNLERLVPLSTMMIFQVDMINIDTIIRVLMSTCELWM